MSGDIFGYQNLMVVGGTKSSSEKKQKNTAKCPTIQGKPP